MNKKILLWVIIIIFIISVICFFYFQKSSPKTEKINIEKPVIVQKTVPERLDNDSLLIQVNKQHCLPADYVPKDLVNILSYGITANKDLTIRKIAVTDLKLMIDQAKKEGIELKIISAYRSYQNQKKIYNSWVEKLGLKEANRQSAAPGCSQHQLGTAADFNDLNFSFADTPEGMWLAKNAWQYGWVISYPFNSEDITGYVYEPWHYRYIGVNNASEMQKSKLILSQFLDTKNNF